MIGRYAWFSPVPVPVVAEMPQHRPPRTTLRQTSDTTRKTGRRKLVHLETRLAPAAVASFRQCGVRPHATTLRCISATGCTHATPSASGNTGDTTPHYAASVNRCANFLDDDDRHHYPGLPGACAAAHGMRIHVHVSINNRVHVLVSFDESGQVSLATRQLGQACAAVFNRPRRRAGTLRARRRCVPKSTGRDSNQGVNDDELVAIRQHLQRERTLGSKRSGHRGTLGDHLSLRRPGRPKRAVTRTSDIQLPCPGFGVLIATACVRIGAALHVEFDAIPHHARTVLSIDEQVAD